MKEYKSNIPKIGLTKAPSNIKKCKIKTSNDAVKYCRQFYHEDIDIYESMFLLLLNRANNTIGYVKISQGGISGTIVDVRLILKYAIESLSPAIILCHNHPSGKIKPSKADIYISKKVKTAAKQMDVDLLDSIIITKTKSYSLADEGEL